MRPLALNWLDVTLPDPSDNLRLDEELLNEGEGVLRVWESASECVVIGHSGQPERDVYVEECWRSSVAIIRRCSGGGAVLLGPGCLNYALVLPLVWNPKWHDVRYSLRWVMERMRAALALPELRCAGQCDLALAGRKVSGSAQRRTRHAVLHHGTLLYRFDAGCAERFLKPPVRQPRYRAGRTHREFLGNLPLRSDQLRQRLAAAWCQREALDRAPLPCFSVTI